MPENVMSAVLTVYEPAFGKKPPTNATVVEINLRHTKSPKAIRT
jgi:hypothetical protein